MEKNQQKIERLSARLDDDAQKMAQYLVEAGYGQTEIVKIGLELLYTKAKNTKPPSIPVLLKLFEQAEGSGPSDLSANRKKYYTEALIEKYTR